VLFATHDRAVTEFADRVLVIDDGRVTEPGEIPHH
jgi:ABC-type dipeptide/oligopeptide/nickel transport system ATPase component